MIELLVVIAIIGILAAIVLVSLSSARDRAKDARIQADLGQIRSVGELFNNDNGTYTGLDGDPDEDTLAADIAAQGGTYVIRINADPWDGYCAYSSLNSGGYWCVDSGLKSVKDDAAPANCAEGCVAAKTCACD